MPLLMLLPLMVKGVRSREEAGILVVVSHSFRRSHTTAKPVHSSLENYSTFKSTVEYYNSKFKSKKLL